MTDQPEPPETPETASMPTDTPPDRLSVNPRSEYHDWDLLRRGVGIRFNGAERTNVEEYCVSEGWIRVAAGKSLDRKGNPLTLKLTGTVEAWYKS
ncbi:DUF3297 family protein [Sandarakinorhabdus sp.]|jgi:hypothetical protein|uniref:DUF3297 family protein n=1 Tax=Sandarakinorhabdus sp. TaxID=1916663 RepID=UPI003341A5A8